MALALEGKIAVVTGANSGIGYAIAEEFIREGALVYITGRRRAELEAAAGRLGDSAIPVLADSTDLPSLDALYETVKERSGRVDVLVANAGGGTGAPLGAITEEAYDTTFDVNVKGTLFTVQKSLPLLADGAAIVLVGSSTSVQGTPALSVYAATKAAIRSLARSWIMDLRGRNVRLNVVSPGPTETPGLRGLAPADKQDAFIASFDAQVPLGRIGTPNEIAKATVFLASDAASFVNGAELFVDGGVAQV
jgi:NAD(P)-dependent dehydrogenase (short-subunit alcohol dehydrogenase family)